MSEEEGKRGTRLEQLKADLKARLNQINDLILDWSQKAEVLRQEEKEIEEVLRKLGDSEPEPVL